MSNFFEETTSNYSDQHEDQSVKQSVKEKKEQTSQKKVIKQSKNFNNYQIAEKYLYHPDMDSIDHSNYLTGNILFVIEKKYLTKRNKNVKKNKIWGTDDYTSKSDPICILLHMGWINFKELKKKRFEALEFILQVKKIKKNYVGCERFGIVSKKFNQPIQKLQNLKPMDFKFSQKINFQEYYYMSEKIVLKRPKKILEIPRKIQKEPSLCFGELVFNSNNELAFKYDLINICDKSTKSTDYLSYLASRYYIVFENKQWEKFVLTISKKENLKFLANEFYYKFYKVKEPSTFDNEFFQKNDSFEDKMDLLEDNLLWVEIFWDNTSIEFKNHHLEDLKNFKFYKIKYLNENEKEEQQLIHD